MKTELTLSTATGRGCTMTRARDKHVKPVREEGYHWVKYKNEWMVGKWDGEVADGPN